MSSPEKVACDHCHLEFSPHVMLTQKEGEKTLYFCCKGCQGVYNLLHDKGLDNFYDHTKTTKLTPQSRKLEESSQFDTPTFLQQFAKKDGELLEISLIIEGIHCAACVWLNEKVLAQTDGVVEVSINFSTNKAKVTWDPQLIKLSQIIDTIRAIGYDAFAYDPTVSEKASAAKKKEYFYRMIVAVFASMNIMWIAIAQYAGFFMGMDSSIKTILNVAEFILATPVLFYSGWVFFRGAYFGLKHHFVNMDILVATGAILTYIYSIFIMITQEGEAYFDSVTMIITFVLLGKFLEVQSKKSASDTLDQLNKHIPAEVRLITESGFKNVTVHDVNVGDLIEVHAGERFALDGTVSKGEGYVDESTLTGESEPCYKAYADHVVSGTTNLTNTLQVEVSKSYENSTFVRLLNLLEDALNKRPPIEQLANHISGYFSTVILLLSIIAFSVWYFGGLGDFGRSFLIGISVIVIACPCALALATPIATLVGVSMGAKKGVLFKEAAHLETMAKTTQVYLDKTGTLTQGKPKVVHRYDAGKTDNKILASLVHGSIHPISKAVYAYLDQEAQRDCFDHYELIAGKGIVADKDSVRYVAGSAEFLKEFGIAFTPLESQTTHFYVAKGQELWVSFELEDPIKEGVADLIAYFERENIEVTLLTGDHQKAADSLAQTLGIKNVQAELKPEEKAHYIKAHKKEGDTVVMVGDGINDIIALANADISIAMGKGADVAVDSSDVVLLHDDLKSLQEAFIISKKSFHLIKQNLWISLMYNVVTIPLAMLGYVIPLIAALSMSLSSLLVVGNSLRVKWMRG